MSRWAIQVSAEARAAYFNDQQAVCLAECQQVLNTEGSWHVVGDMAFVLVEGEFTTQDMARLSFAQGLWRIEDDQWQPHAESLAWPLHTDFIFGSKFKGKTNERLTQLLLNVALSEVPNSTAPLKMLDPMAGRGTSLLWAIQYGLSGWGIEADKAAIPDFRQVVKKWCKVHRQKHKALDGQVTPEGFKKGLSFLQFEFGEQAMRLQNGQTEMADRLLKKPKFDLLISDLPYGVQHFAASGQRSPEATLAEALPAWRKTLKKGAPMALAFNRYLPKRDVLEKLVQDAGFEVLPFTAQHRMSESIVRDVLLAKA